MEEINERAKKLVVRLHQGKAHESLRIEIVEGRSAVGGGAAPTSDLPTALISLSHRRLTPNEIEAGLRHSKPPVIGRIENDRAVLDLRTVAESEEPELEQAILSLPA